MRKVLQTLGSGAFGILLSGTLSAQTGTQITIRVTAVVDSNHPVAQYAGTVKNALALGSLQIPAGSPAVMKLVPANTHPRTWTLSLVSVKANGGNVAVPSNSPSLAGLAGVSALNAPVSVSQVTQALGGKFGGKAKPAAPASKPQNAAAVPAVTGAHVYVPALADVSFAVAQTTATLATAPAAAAAQQRPASAVAAPVAAAPVTGGTSAVPAAAPSAAAQAVPAAGSPASAQAAAPSAGSAVVQYDGLQYQLQSCKREAPHIICEIQITNQRGSDAHVFGGQQTYYFDQSGNRVGASAVKVSNCPDWGNCQLLPNVPVTGHLEFVDVDGKATQLLRLQLWLNRKAVAQFTNIPIQ